MKQDKDGLQKHFSEYAFDLGKQAIATRLGSKIKWSRCGMYADTKCSIKVLRSRAFLKKIEDDPEKNYALSVSAQSNGVLVK